MIGELLTKKYAKKGELYNLRDKDGNYPVFKVIHEFAIPSSRHGLFMGCIHLCDGDINEAYKTYAGIIQGKISIDAVIDALVHVYVSGTGVALYKCHESIISSAYSTSREHIREEIEMALRESLKDIPHLRDNTDPVQVVSFKLPKSN